MMRINKHSLLLLLLGAGMTIVGCAETGGTFGAIGQRFSNPDDKEETDEDEGMIEPQEVAGAFLTCAYMDDQQTVVSKIKESETAPDTEVHIGCGVYRGEHKVNTQRLSFAWMVHHSGNKLDQMQPLGGNMHFEAILPVKARHFGDTIVVIVTSPDSRRAIRQKSIRTIQSFNARTGFNIVSDIGLNTALFEDLSTGGGDGQDVSEGDAGTSSQSFCEMVANLGLNIFGYDITCNSIVNVFFGAPPAKPQTVQVSPSGTAQQVSFQSTQYKEVPFYPNSQEFQDAGRPSRPQKPNKPSDQTTTQSTTNQTASGGEGSSQTSGTNTSTDTNSNTNTSTNTSTGNTGSTENGGTGTNGTTESSGGTGGESGTTDSAGGGGESGGSEPPSGDAGTTDGT